MFYNGLSGISHLSHHTDRQTVKLTFTLGSLTVRELSTSFIVMISSSFRESSFLFRGRLRTYNQKPQSFYASSSHLLHQNFNWNFCNTPLMMVSLLVAGRPCREILRQTTRTLEKTNMRCISYVQVKKQLLLQTCPFKFQNSCKPWTYLFVQQSAKNNRVVEEASRPIANKLLLGVAENPPQLGSLQDYCCSQFCPSHSKKI